VPPLFCALSPWERVRVRVFSPGLEDPHPPLKSLPEGEGAKTIGAANLKLMLTLC